MEKTSPTNENLFSEYWNDIQRNLREEESKPEFDVTDNLARHEVTDSLRSRMIDWMVEVLTNFRCSHQAYFMATSLLDQFFKQSSGRIPVKDLHLSGVAAMFIASKYEDIYPLKLSIIYEKIAHKKLAVSEIKDREHTLISTLDFHLRKPTILDFLLTYEEHALKPTLKD